MSHRSNEASADSQVHVIFKLARTKVVIVCLSETASKIDFF